MKHFTTKPVPMHCKTKLSSALENLAKAIQLKPDENRELAKTDSDFDTIRDDPRFQTLLTEQLE
jgi:hypothetical protein